MLANGTDTFAVKPFSGFWYAFLIATVLISSLVLRVGVATRSPSMYFSDEIYQTQEQAHRLAYGYGVIPWEFRVGARSYVFPAFLAGVMRATDWMGKGSQGYLLGIAVVLSLISLTTVWFGFAWSNQVRGPAAAVVGGLARLQGKHWRKIWKDWNYPRRSAWTVYVAWRPRKTFYRSYRMCRRLQAQRRVSSAPGWCRSHLFGRHCQLRPLRTREVTALEVESQINSRNSRRI